MLHFNYLKFQEHKILFALVIIIIAYTFGDFSVAQAKASSGATFRWVANPAHENIIGYKLYYGKKSRYDSAGNEKTNFKYDVCVNFYERKRCTGKNFSNCEKLSSKELKCKGLSSNDPQCTLTNVNGGKYFSLTAYNADDESSFTREVTQTPVVTAAFIPLLLK